MKRNYILICALAACATIFFSACQKEVEEVQEGKSFNLSFQIPHSKDAKVYIDASNYPVWESGDEVKINTQTIAVSNINTTAHTASITGVTSAAPYIAGYPASAFTIADGVTTVTIPSTQTYSVAGNNQKVTAPMVAYNAGNDNNLRFNNVCSLLKFSVTAPDASYTKLTKIKVTETNGKKISGSYTVNPADGSLTSTDAASNSSVTFTNNGTEINCSTAQTIYMYISPVENAKLNFELTFSNNDGTRSESYSRTMARTITCGRNTYYSVPADVSANVWRKNGLFSVSGSKKVHFTKGNLYWDGSTYHLESNQYDYPTSWNTSHIGYFYWSKTASVSYAETYADEQRNATDKLYCGEDNPLTVEGTSNLYCLSKDEWTYLISSRTNASSLYRYGVTVADKGNCLVIAPDGYAGSIADSYTADEWVTAEHVGLVCLPFTNYRDGSGIVSTGGGSPHYYWASTPDNSDATYANVLYITNSTVLTNGSSSRSYGWPIRLVQTAQ